MIDIEHFLNDINTLLVVVQHLLQDLEGITKVYICKEFGKVKNAKSLGEALKYTKMGIKQNLL